MILNFLYEVSLLLFLNSHYDPQKKFKVYVPTIVPKYPIRFRKKLSYCLEIVPEVFSMCHIFSNDLPSIRERKQEI
jgi:hypothetical protein